MKRLIISEVPADYSPQEDIVLGPWCFSNQQDQFFTKDFSCEKDPYENFSDLSADAKLSKELTQHQIDRLTIQLNQKLCSDYSRNYWGIILTPFLSTLVQVLIERTRRIEQLMQKYPEGLSMTLHELDKTSWNFQDTLEFFTQGVINFKFNHWLISEIIKAVEPSQYVLYKKTMKRDAIQAPTPGLFAKVKRALKKQLLADNFLNTVYGFDLVESMRWEHRLKRKKVAESVIENQAVKKRQKEAGLPFSIDHIIDMALPIELGNYVQKKLPKKPRNIVLGPSLYFEEETKRKVASYREVGSRIFTAQHGSRYGTLESIPYISDVEYGFDGLITWGWEAQADHECQFIPLPSPYLKPPERSEEVIQKGKTIFVGQHSSLISYRLDSVPQPLQILESALEIEGFLSTLNKRQYNELYFKPYPKDTSSLDYLAYAKREHPRLKILNRSLNEVFGETKLAIIDHPGTVLHQTLAANIPTIAYWRPDHWSLSKQAKPFFEQLTEAKILFQNGKEAAKHLNMIGDNLLEWWNGSDVQVAVKAWSKQFAWYDTNWRNNWRAFIKNL